MRIADTAAELIDNRRGEPEVLATPRLALEAMIAAAGDRTPSVDREWTAGLRRKHEERVAAAGAEPAQTGPDGKIHPAQIFSAIAAWLRNPIRFKPPTAVIS